MSAVSLAVVQDAADELAHSRPPAGPTFSFLSAQQLLGCPAQKWAIHGIFPEYGVVAIYGTSGSGKSCAAMDMGAALAEGGYWFGHKVGYAAKPRFRVFHLVLEGQAGTRAKVAAWERANARAFPPETRFVHDAFHLNNREHVIALAAAIEAAGGADVVVVDTLNRATPGSDENSARDMGLIIANAAELQGMFGGLLILVAHTGKDASRGMRGHSSLFAAMDAVIEVTRSGDSRQWRAEKVKDGRDGHTHPFRLEVVEIGADDDGAPVTSCVVRPAADPAANPRPKPPTSGNQRIVYDVLAQLLRESKDFGKASAPDQRPCVLRDAAIEQIKGRLPVEQKRQRERCAEAISGLVARQVLMCDEGWIWMP